MCEPINLKAPEGICLTVAEVNVLLDPDPHMNEGGHN
jgi:hypothetical protein